MIKTKEHEELEAKLYIPWIHENQKRNFDRDEDSDEQLKYERALRNVATKVDQTKAISHLSLTCRENRKHLSTLLQPFLEEEKLDPIDLNANIIVGGVIQSPYYIP